MNIKLDEKLCKKFPKIFAQRSLPMNETAMCWGFECGDGWYTLINNLCRDIQKHCDEKGFQTEATQVKEKYGGLRFYVDSADDAIFDMIDKAEAESFKICEDCGTTEFVEVRNGGWIKTLCDDCAGIERGYN